MGRPREFDVDEALDRAMKVFWLKGYEGTTIPDLTEAMGINRPSLYAAFGNKESLFRKAIDRYSENAGHHVREALNEPSANRVVETLLRGTLEVLTNPSNPHGCLLVQAALSCGEDADCVRRELIERRELIQKSLCDRFERACKEKDLPADASPTALARYLTAVMHGMAVQAAGGATRAELQGVVELTLRAWPLLVARE
jgi:AcrR family transcriptional regulator